MSKEKLHVDPGDEARLRKQGPQPTAEDLLSNEQPVLVDEMRNTVTSRDVNDEGVPRIRVTPLRVTDGGGMPRSNIPTVAQSIHEAAEARRELQEQARADIIGAVETWKAAPTCSHFQTRGGHGEIVGIPTWCREAACPAWRTEGCCTMGKLGSVDMLVGRAQPANRDELAELLKAPGTRLAADTEDRVQARVAEICAEIASSKRAEAAATAERDEEIRELRRAERTKVKIEFVTAENVDVRRRAAHDAARMR